MRRRLLLAVVRDHLLGDVRRHLLVTTRSPGFPYHAWPYDFWRYEPADMREIFRDLDILTVERDPIDAGVFVLARRPVAFVERTPDVALMSMVTGRREHVITDRQIQVFMVRRKLRTIATSVRRSRNRAWRWLPFPVRSTVKRALGRA